MRKRFDSAYIRTELTQLGHALETPLTAYLIGGGAMAFLDLKDTTKDIDLIVTSGKDLQRLQTVLLEHGYGIVKEPGAEYETLGAQRILENDDGCRIDIFNQQVIDKLVLSEGMKQRSEIALETRTLSVGLVSTEDMFLFKAVAGRTDDIEDMFVLVQTDLDYEVIEEALHRQIDLLGQELFVSYMNEALLALEDRHHITTPLFDTVSTITERVYQELTILHAIDDSATVTELRETLDISSDEIDAVIRGLQNKDVVTVEGDLIEKTATTL